MQQNQETVISPESLKAAWSDRRVSFHLLFLHKIQQWECKILGNHIEYRFTAKSYKDLASQVLDAGQSKDYFNEEPYKTNFYLSGEMLKERRKALNLSQKVFAAELRKKGAKVSQSYISELEAGMYNINKKIHKALEELERERY
ncbi:MAG: helix-turn-helix domain-containing protein [Spirochaetota bacterium]